MDWTHARNARCPGSTRIVCLDEAGDLAPLAAEGGVHALGAVRSRSPWDRRAVAKLRELLVGPSASVDVVHSHNTAARQYAGLAARRTGIPHVHTEHGTNVYARGLRNRLRNAVLSRLTRRTIAVSEDTAGALVAAGIGSRASIEVIPNGVAVGEGEAITNPGAQHARDGLGIPGGAMVVGSVGRQASVKGYDRLLRAFAALTPALPHSRTPILLLVGDGPEREALEAQAAELGIAGRVRFAGYRADARTLLPAFDLFVLPSRSEGLSVALLEAMAEGVPVLVTDVGESRRVLDDGRCGALLPEDEGEWGRVIGDRLSVIRDRSGEVGEQVARARERVAECYSLAATLDAYERVYRDVLT